MSAQAHGLDGTLVEPDWPPLTHEEVCSVLAGYPKIKPPFRILTVSPRPFSAASVVAASDRRVFLKRHARTVRDAEGLREEHRFMAHLRANGAPVPQVFVADIGDTALEAGDWTYEIHSAAEGADLYEDAISWTPFQCAEHAHEAGRMLARLHLASRGYDAPGRTNRPLVAGFTIFAVQEPAAEFDRYVQTRPALREYLSSFDWRDEALELLAPFHTELLPLLPALAPLWTHNDLHASNLFWAGTGRDARATGVIDFGLCDRTNAVHDLAQAIERNVVEWLTLMNDPAHPECVAVHRDHLWALLDGYESTRPLAAEERAALAPMLALCHAEFALSEADYFLTVLHSKEKAGVACDDYLVVHARSWRGAGAPLLEDIRNWADTQNRKAGPR